MENYSEHQKKRRRAQRKERKKKPVVLIILGIILLLILGVLLFFYIKIKRMSRNAPPLIPTAIELPSVTAAPAELVDIDPNYINIPDDGSEPDEEFWRRLQEYDDLYNQDHNQSMAFDNDGIYFVPRIDPNVLNILILGNDTMKEYDQGRSDTMMLLSYNTKTRRAKLVSFLRDTYIYIPGRDKWNRINAAFQYGGVGLAINTINVNFGLDIQNYIRVDFKTMQQLVDAVGGIDVELTLGEIRYINRMMRSPRIPETPGVHHLSGAQALCHSRNRYVGHSYDWGRTQRQRNIMYAIFNRAKQEKNAVALMSLMYRLVDKLDTNLDIEQMVSLGVDVVFGGSFNMDNTAVPFAGTWSYANERGMEVIRADISANRARLHEYLYGR